MIRVIFTTEDGRADEALVFFANRDGVRSLSDQFGMLANGQYDAIDLATLDFVECDGVTALGAEVAPAENESTSPFFQRFLKRMISRSPRRGLMRTHCDARGTGFVWLLDRSYWEEFVERLEPLVSKFREGSYCYLPSGYCDDATVIVECRANI
jgi:hypothetical protein